METELRCEINFKRKSTILDYIKTLIESIYINFKCLYHLVVLFGFFLDAYITPIQIYDNLKFLNLQGGF